MDQVFISYSRTDEAFARKLAAWISKTLDIEIWIDIDDIPPGMKWSQAIQQGLDLCQVMIVIITPDSMASRNVEDEWQYFLDSRKPIIPLLLKSADVPFQLRRIQYIDFSVKDDYPESLRQLVYDLRHKLSPTPGETQDEAERAALTPQSHPMVSRREQIRRGDVKPAQSGGRLKWLVIGLIVILLAAVGGAIATFVLLNQTRIQYVVMNGPGNAVVYLPGQEHPVPLSSLDSLPPGSRIVSNGDTVQVVMEGNDTSAILDPDTDAAINDFDSETLGVGVNSGRVSLSTNLAGRGSVTTPNYGVNVDFSGQSVSVNVDESADTVNTACFVGDCTVSDEGGQSRDLGNGEQITVNGIDHDIDTAEISPTSGSITFVSYRNGSADIFTMNADGSRPRNITNSSGASELSPSWSPDGSRIVFMTTRDGNAEIYVMNVDGSNARNLTNDNGTDRQPEWSPDGTRIAFISNRDGNFDVWIMDSDGSNPRNLTNSPFPEEKPTWSPDSTRIAYTAQPADNREIFVLLADGSGEPMNITNNPAHDFEPAWSPVAERIVFVSRRDGTEELYLTDSDGENVERLTNDTIIDSAPDWSPDGRRVIFATQRVGNYEIFRLDIETGEAVNLTNLNNIEDRDPSWLPVIRQGDQ